MDRLKHLHPGKPLIRLNRRAFIVHDTPADEAHKFVCYDITGVHGFGPTEVCAFASWEARRKARDARVALVQTHLADRRAALID